MPRLGRATLILAAAPLLVAASGPKPRLVTFSTADGATLEADLYGHGARGVVLAHGARFDKESWAEQARVLADAGFLVAAINFRGYGGSMPPDGVTDSYQGLHEDVLAAVRYLRREGAEEVSIVGGSMGGWAAADASVESEPGEIDRLILLAHGPIDHPEYLKGRKLFIVARGDARGDGGSRLELVREQYERAPDPKELIVLEGDAHAQWIFATEQGDRLMAEILRFLDQR